MSGLSVLLCCAETYYQTAVVDFSHARFNNNDDLVFKIGKFSRPILENKWQRVRLWKSIHVLLFFDTFTQF